MPSKKNARNESPSGKHFETVREVLGYLNFSSGNSDPAFLRNIDLIWKELPGKGSRREALRKTLHDGLDRLAIEQPAFADAAQARLVIDLALDRLFTAYRTFHSDLFFHLQDADFEAPFFMAALLQAVLQNGPVPGEEDRIIAGALQSLNDYVGYRPVAVLENGRRMEIYPHERFRPLPVFVAGAGVADGPYHDLLEQTLEFLKMAPQDILHESHFYLDHLDELAVDQRAYDHLHPVNKRTNYLFGEWDPHRIDNQGDYRRFVVRQIILDSLQSWIDDNDSRTKRSERLFDAAAALCGTMLMASSVSGSGPATHDSTTSLTTLLPVVARRRDQFYARVMDSITGDRRQRLLQEEKKTQQPFGHVRQYLNMRLAGHGAQQVQHRELAHLYAMMGYAEAGRKQAMAIPAVSIRLETEVECTVSTANAHLNAGDVAAAFAGLKTIPGLLQRGIECGGFVDPWNILGFHGQFPLFASREDSIPDNRIETLLSLMEQIFDGFSRCLGEAAARGQSVLREEVSATYRSLAEWWDRFGSHVIEDLPDVAGVDSWESAAHVSNAMAEWRQAGESSGDISFWRNHVESFQSAQSYALVVDALLKKQDHVASMGLLMEWLGQMDQVGFECPQHSLFSLLIRWMKLVSSPSSGEDPAPTVQGIRRLFDFLEANADDWWSVPQLGTFQKEGNSSMTDDLEFGGPGQFPAPTDEEDDVFGAAYDGVVFRDSAEDGNWGDTADGDAGFRHTEFETLNRDMEPRLKFLNAVGQLWQMASARFAGIIHTGTDLFHSDPRLLDAIIGWHRQAQRWQIDLAELMESVWDHEIIEPTGDHDSNVEYDIQLQVKFYLLLQIISALICLRNAERLLNGIIPPGADVPRGTEQDRQLARMYRAVIQRDVSTVRELLPPLLSRLSRNPLLYIPLDHGGEPGQILRIQALQSVVRFLLRELPRLGLLKETWHLLYAAFRMERKWRPKGQAITEFDRLFTIALRSSLQSLVASVRSWSGEKEIDNEELIDAINRVVDPYQWLWLEHSRTMRISAVDGLRNEPEWDGITRFIKRYGGDLFHASQLTLGNVRAILHNGVDWFLDYLEDEQDPLHPIKLLEDLDRGLIDRDDAEWCLEQVYSIIVDRFDRFLEYNTTTTQSDYGEMIYSLLDFLRLEALYDRDAWNLTPQVVVHEVLVRNGLMMAAEVREAAFEVQTAELADRHLADLARLQKQYGMRMPTITDHLKERFVKPLAVNRMLALVSSAVNDARDGAPADSAVFELLSEEVDNYLEDSWGSGVDIPDWLRALEREVSSVVYEDEGGRPGMEADLELPSLTLSREDFLKQARTWRDSLTPKNRRSRKSEGPRPRASDESEDESQPPP